MARNESRHFPLPEGPIVRTKPGSIFRDHDDRTGMPIPEGYAVRAGNGDLIDGRPHRIDRWRGSLVIPDPVVPNVIEQTYLPEWEAEGGG